jgi:hypothetical protein
MDTDHALFWACAAVCGLAELLILRAAFWPTTDASASAGIPRSPRGVEILWGILPALALGAVFWASWRTLY